MNHDSFHWGVRHSDDDDGETLHLRNLGSQRSYGTCSYGDGSAFGSMYSHRFDKLIEAYLITERRDICLANLR